tara:strand:+ start:360 stop:914 length:555 start_codon:yes stop_codon:yes gene_type:complete
MGGMNPATMFMITAGVTAGASLYQGYQQRQALESDIARYEEEKKVTELRGIQEENLRRQQMEITLGNNKVIAGAAGILDDSRSFLTIQNDVRNSAIEDIRSQKLNTRIALSKYDQQIINSKIDMQSATFGSIVDAGSSILNGWTYMNYYRGPSKTIKPGMSPGESIARFGTTNAAGMYSGGNEF